MTNMSEYFGLYIALISAVSVVAGATIPVMLQNRNKRKIEIAEAAQIRFEAALADIEYLYALVEVYKEELKTTFGTSDEKYMRKRVVDEYGYRWSGKFTPSRIAHYRNHKVEWDQALPSLKEYYQPAD